MEPFCVMYDTSGYKYCKVLDCMLPRRVDFFCLFYHGDGVFLCVRPIDWDRRILSVISDFQSGALLPLGEQSGFPPPWVHPSDSPDTPSAACERPATIAGVRPQRLIIDARVSALSSGLSNRSRVQPFPLRSPTIRYAEPVKGSDVEAERGQPRHESSPVQAPAPKNLPPRPEVAERGGYL